MALARSPDENFIEIDASKEGLGHCMSKSTPSLCAHSDLWVAFGIETVIPYVAVLLKRRVVIIAGDADHAVILAKTLTQLVPHRADTSILYPSLRLVSSGETYKYGRNERGE
jgi:hypothetical protein